MVERIKECVCEFCQGEISHPENQPNIHYFNLSDNYAHILCFDKHVNDLDGLETPPQDK